MVENCSPAVPAKAFGPTGGFKTFRVTPSLVTEWACKACAYAHARFDSAVTHHPPADFAIANEIRKWPSKFADLVYWECHALPAH